MTRLISLGLSEDIGLGDHTTLACVPEKMEGCAHLLIKDKGVLAGVKAVEWILHTFDGRMEMEMMIEDGTEVKPGDVAFLMKGRMRSLLHTERLILNILQRMSGIATETRRYVEAVKGTKARVLDTRKTSPGMRILDKEAVRLGGGGNHRFGLYDMILIKDNHVDAAGGIKEAIERVKTYLQEQRNVFPIEVEVRNREELETVLSYGGVERILLDNFSVEMTAEAVACVGKRYEVESSGNITLENIRNYALTGVNYISVGALTHSVKGLDMSLKVSKG